MNVADIISLFIIIIFTALGTLMGSVRSISAFVGIILATNVCTQLLAKGTTPGGFIGAFLGIFFGVTVVGFLIYGRSKTTLIESFEGVFGFVFGLMAGWGFARLVLMTALYFYPDSGLAIGTTPGAMIAWDIYDITPFRIFLTWTSKLNRNIE